jgi:trehalose synthase
MRAAAVLPRSTDGFDEVLPPEERVRLDRALDELRDRLAGRTVWHVNSTSASGGVAELLSSLLPYQAGRGIDVRWLVIEGDAAFFDLTKRLHNRLHESGGDGGPIGPAERSVYDATMATEGAALVELVRPGDVVVLHDPQPAGLAPVLRRHGARVVWRCHVGVDEPGPLARSAWDFLLPAVAEAEVVVFSRAAYRWDGLGAVPVVFVPPCIDVLAAKNRPLDDGARDAVLDAAGILAAADGRADGVAFARRDGTVGVVEHAATCVGERPIPPDAPVVVQVSRWDRLKDPSGLVRAFASQDPDERGGAHLVVAGPETASIGDDPEQGEIFAEVREVWADLAPRDRRDVHLVCLPMGDLEENAVVVNALQRRADVVVQKSLVEGFGLTVTEAMWKARPVVAARVGGIQDQIAHGRNGFLIEDPRDDVAFGRAVVDLLADPSRGRALGRAAHDTVCDGYLPVHHFRNEARLFDALFAS